MSTTTSMSPQWQEASRLPPGDDRPHVQQLSALAERSAATMTAAHTHLRAAT
jgi:hypothetical protein